MTTVSKATRPSRNAGMFTKPRGKVLVVSAATVVCLYLCYLLAQPFIPALTWAIAGAVVTQGFVRWLGSHIQSPSWRALVATSVVTVVLFVPTIGLIYFAAIEVAGTLQNWEPTPLLGQWQETLQGWPRLQSAWNRTSQNIDLTAAIGQLAEQVRDWATAFVAGSVYSFVQALIALFVLFYLYRDEERILTNVRELSPLTSRETNRLLNRLGDTVFATIFGTVVVAMIQGTLGGIVFWLLGLPAPVLWGTVMTLLAMIPYMGAFVVWAPISVILVAQGDWGKGLALAAWGAIAIGLIDNLVYPILVGNRLRQHTVITFLAILGGLAVFGASGIVLGPVVVSITFFLLEVWRHRTAGGRSADTA